MQNGGVENRAYLFHFFKGSEGFLGGLKLVFVCYCLIGSYCELEIVRNESAPCFHFFQRGYLVEGGVYFYKVEGFGICQ